MTPEHLDEIRARMKDSTTKWNILLAQSDRANLLAYIETLEARLAAQVPINAYHATCPSCGAAVDVIPGEGTVLRGEA